MSTLNTLEERSQTIFAVDLFTAGGMADVLMSADFWRKVRRALHPGGAICINAWSGDVERLNTLLGFLERWVAHGGSIFQVDHRVCNVVIFATPQPLERSAMSSALSGSMAPLTSAHVDEITAPRSDPRWVERRVGIISAHSGSSDQHSLKSLVEVNILGLVTLILDKLSFNKIYINLEVFALKVVLS